MTQPYHHGNLREALLEAAREIIAEEGPRGLRLRAIARRAGVSPAAPYRHFRDLEAVFAAIATEGFERFSRYLEEAGAGIGDPLARLGALGEAYVRFALQNPAAFRVMFGDRIGEPEAHPGLEAAGRRAFAPLEEAIRAGLASARMRGDDPEAMILLAWSSVHGLATLLLEGKVPLEGDASRLAGRLARVLFAGLEAD